MGSASILKTQSTGSADHLHVGRERGLEVLASVTGRTEPPPIERGKTVGGAGFVKEDQALGFGHIKLEALKKKKIETEEKIIALTGDKSCKTPMNRFH